MALSLITSYFVQSSTQGTTPLTTPSFTPSNGEIIVVKLETWDTAVPMGAPTGGTQTYTSRVIAAPGGFNPWAGIYTAVISGSPGAMTISSTPSATSRNSMTVERWSGAQLAATPVTASANATSGAATASLAPTGGATSVISWVAGDSQSIDPSTRAYLSSGTDEGVRDDHVGSSGVGYHGRQASTGTGSQAFGLSAPTGMKFGIAGIEIQASASTAPTFPPSQITRRRIGLAPRMPRSSARVAAPVRAQINPPFPVNSVKQPRELRGMRSRRGRAFAPVSPQVALQAPAPALQAVHTRLRGLRLFHGRTVAPVPAQVVVLPPAYPVRPSRPRQWGLRLLRGRAVAPVQLQTVPAPPAYPPPPVRVRVRGLSIRRARSASPTPGQLLPVAPSFSPPAVRARVKGLLRRLGRSTVAPVPQLPVPSAAHGRPRMAFPRRARAAGPVSPQIVVAPPAYPLPSSRPRLKGMRLARGRSSMPTPPQVVLVAPKTVPVAARIRRKLAGLFRGQVATPVPASTACDCTTHRPSLGTTIRPAGGTTVRPGSGMTLRPSTGSTARPSGGTTTRPCSCQD